MDRRTREALKDVPDDAPVRIGIAEDPGDFGGYRSGVLVDDWQPGTYDQLD
ncbi:DUF6225 family protein [Streptomyces sp. NPDC047985]|uniref:DUF6225 family protein n=1 Tax=Streptomyces sp. NPDC047985 TaxID=3155384 RepID=UPI003438E32A